VANAKDRATQPSDPGGTDAATPRAAAAAPGAAERGVPHRRAGPPPPLARRLPPL